MRLREKLEITPREDRMIRREHLRCAICPPHRGENRTRWVKRGVQKPRYKNKRRVNIPRREA
jgi:hypothetical protein